MAEYTLENPFVELTFSERPSTLFVAAFFAVTLLVVAVLFALFVVALPAWVGFKTTVLIGLFLIILADA